MTRTKQVRLKIVRISLKTEIKGGKIINEMTLDLDGAFQYKKIYEGINDDALLKMNVGDAVIARISLADKKAVRVKQPE